MAKVVVRESAGAEGDGEGDFYEGMLDEGQAAQPAAKAVPTNKKPKRKGRPSGEPYKPVPPVEHRFQPGLSGNPKGRPRKPKPLAPVGLLSHIAAELRKERPISHNGKTVMMSGEQIAAMRIVHDMLGDRGLDRARVFKMLVALGFTNFQAELDELSARIPEPSTGWTPEMEAAMAVIDADFLDPEPNDPANAQ
jgi:hypothetical protein